MSVKPTRIFSKLQQAYGTLSPRIKFLLYNVSVLFVLVVVYGVVAGIPQIIRYEINKSIELREGTDQYERFIQMPYPIVFKVHVFNVENPDAIMEGHTPIVKEKGPYVFKEYVRKKINNTNEDDDTISFYKETVVEFDAQASGELSDDDIVTIINIPFLSSLQVTENAGLSWALPMYAKCAHSIFGNLSTLFINVSIKDFVLNGIKFCDPNTHSICEPIRALTCKISAHTGDTRKHPDGSLSFAFLNYKIFATTLLTMKRGFTNIGEVGVLTKLNNESFMDNWRRNSECNRVDGLEGTVFPPHLTKTTPLAMYSADLCRTMKMKFMTVKNYKNIEGYLFTIDNSTIRDESPSKIHNCICVNKTKDIHNKKNCYLDGVFDIQPCKDVPVLLSLPHFLWADEHYGNGVQGVSANETLHKSFFLIEPNTGAVLTGVTRVQLNVVLRPTNAHGLRKLPRTYLPVLWIEEQFLLSDFYVNELNRRYFTVVAIVGVFKWILLVIGVCLAAVFGASFLVTTRKS